MDPDERQRALRAWVALITDWWELHHQPELADEPAIDPRKEPPR